MKCLSCDTILSDYEATRVYQESGEHVDLCQLCFKPIEEFVKVVDRKDLLTPDEQEEDYNDYKE